MVFFFACTGRDFPGYAETDWDYLDEDVKTFNDKVRYKTPEIVPDRLKQPGVIKSNQGFALDPNSLPKKLLWRNDDVPDVLPHYIVSDRFRALVSSFEPSVHQFIPIEIYQERNGSPVTTYYWFIVCQRLDSVSREQTTYVYKSPDDNPSAGHWFSRVRNPETGAREQIPGAKLIYDAARTSGKHIWCDPHVLTRGDHLCSREFGEAAIAANFSGLAFAVQPTSR